MLDTENYMPRLRADYDDRIKAAMIEEFGYKNEMMVPRLDKIVLNNCIFLKRYFIINIAS